MDKGRPRFSGLTQAEPCDDGRYGIHHRYGRRVTQGMQLKLKVVGDRGLVPAEALEFRVDPAGGVIGRSPDNEFVLPDPDKYVSRKHGLLKFENGEFYFTDTSAAGTFFSNRGLLLQHDTLALKDGDQLRIGNYDLQVEIEQPAALEPWPTTSESWPEVSESWTRTPEPWPAAEAPASPAPTFAETPLDHLFADPFGSEPAPPAETPSFFGQPDVAPEHSSYAPPEPLPDLAPAEPSPSPPGFNPLDLLDDIGEPGTPAEPPESSWQLSDDFFGTPPLPAAPGPAAPAAAVKDLAPPAATGFPAPDGVDLTPGPATARPPAPTPPLAPPESATRPIAPPVEAPAPSRPPEPRPPVPSPPVPPTPVPTPPAAPAESRTSAAEADLFQRFLEGAGLGDLPMPRDERLPILMKTLGLLFHDLVDGMITALRARAEEKRELRVETTTMRPVNNNPLKSVPSAREAMAIMLAASDGGFLGPVEAVREGFRDLMSHQMATTAGLQASLADQLKRFDPASFEKLFEEGIVFQKKTKCWDAYAKAYPELVRESLENVFGDEFREVYERQMRILRSAAEPFRE